MIPEDLLKEIPNGKPDLVNDAKQYRFADSNGGGGRDVLNLLSGYKGGYNQLVDASGVDLRGVKVPVFATPNQILDKERSKTTSSNDVLDLLDKTGGFLRDPEFPPYESSRMGQNSSVAGHIQTPKSDFQFNPLLDFHRSPSMTVDSLGKRDSHYEPDILQVSEGRKRALNEMLMEPLQSPIIQPQLSESHLNSPSHSLGGRFKLHASRKNSDLNELNNELKISKRPSSEEPNNLSN